MRYRDWLFCFYCAVIFSCSITSFMLRAQNFSNGFAFSLPPRDSTSQPFIPTFPIEPIGANDFVQIDSEGHFAVQGKRIRFWGTNAVADGAFPGLDKAAFIAGRLRKMGFNLIRFHHMDNPWSNYSLFERNRDTRHLNPVMLNRFEKFISELKKNGIYVNINLHVSRTFNRWDGIADADSIAEFGKAVSYFDPQLLPLYKEYAQQLLTHVNPYTGLSLVQDPVMAMVEITNENSLYRWWRDGWLKPFSQGGHIMTRHSLLLDTLWRDFLAAKYGSTEALREAWNRGIRDASTLEMVRDGTFEKAQLFVHWQLEQHQGASASMAIETNQPYEGNFCSRVQVTNATGTDWHVQWKQISISIRRDSSYIVRFAARADQPRTIGLAVMRDTSPWTVYASQSFPLTSNWQVFTLSFRASEDCQVTRLSFHLGRTTGTFWFDDIHFTLGNIMGLEAEETLANVRRIEYNEAVGYSDARVADMSAFYIKLQDDFFAEMVFFLKNNLGVRVPITGTNWNVGPADLVVQDKLDYIDTHAYWDHPQFPNQPWSQTDWYINNTPMVLDKGGGTLMGAVVAVPTVKKPFTISEYNHPFPNRYQSEGPLFLCGYGAFHDADAVMFFDYGGSNDQWENDFIDGYFAIHRNTAMMCLMPSCAYAFRHGWIAPARQTIAVSYSSKDILLLPKNDSGSWWGPNLVDWRLGMQHAVRNASFDAIKDFDKTQLPSAPANPITIHTGELIWDNSGVFKVVTPYFVGLTGIAERVKSQEAGPLRIVNISDFAACTWISVDGQPLAQSNKSLFTLSSRCQNTGMVWDGTTTIRNRWGTSPTQMQALRLTVNLAIPADSIRIYPLNPSGMVEKAGTTYLPNAQHTFEVIFDQAVQKTVWYGIERYGVGTGLNTRTQTVEGFQLSAYPNPLSISASANIIFSLTTAGRTCLDVYNIAGQRVLRLLDEPRTAGQHLLHWDGRAADGRPLASGVYFYRLEHEVNGFQHVLTCKFVLMD